MAYIDRDLLLKDIDESVVFSVRSGKTSPEIRGANKIIDRIKNAPTADVVEVKRGEWKNKPIAGYSNIRCSVCNSVFTSQTGKWNYCPNCGAIMNGGKEE